MKVLVGMSGGVDSSVAALLLKEQGYEVIGAFLKLWSGSDGKNPCWTDDRREALRAAAQVDIPLVEIDGEAEFRDGIVQYLVNGYADGETPNPDIRCNELLKFPLLMREAERLGCDMIATGHYAQTRDGRLYRSADEEKDQTYFLYRLDAATLRRTLFPIGDLTKEEVRTIARRAGLPNADRRSSRGVCFVGQVKMKDFLAARSDRPIGQIVTIGQRVEGQYVVAKERTTNTVMLADRPGETSEAALRDVHWISEPASNRLMARIRHRQQLQNCVLDGQTVMFEAPQTGIASGQSIVFYDGAECLGGGIIV